jgi:hypothetical protein
VWIECNTTSGADIVQCEAAHLVSILHNLELSSCLLLLVNIHNSKIPVTSCKLPENLPAQHRDNAQRETHVLMT